MCKLLLSVWTFIHRWSYSFIWFWRGRAHGGVKQFTNVYTRIIHWVCIRMPPKLFHFGFSTISVRRTGFLLVWLTSRNSVLRTEIGTRNSDYYSSFGAIFDILGGLSIHIVCLPSVPSPVINSNSNNLKWPTIYFKQWFAHETSSLELKS
jgi:hypothetical protein